MGTFVVCKSCAYKVTSNQMLHVTIHGCLNCGEYEFIISIENKSDRIIDQESRDN